MKRKFVGMTNREYVESFRHVGLDPVRKLDMPCSEQFYCECKFQCGLINLSMPVLKMNRADECKECFDKPAKRNGRWILKEVKAE